jgi:hypothetical protein
MHLLPVYPSLAFPTIPILSLLYDHNGKQTQKKERFLILTLEITPFTILGKITTFLIQKTKHRTGVVTQW